jgi:hypothetical protein
MVKTFNWSDYTAASTVLSTELNSLANAGNAISAAIDNTSTGFAGTMWSDWELYLNAPATARTTGCYVGFYVLPSVDGTNYAYGGTSLDPSPNRLVGTFVPDASASARYCALTHVQLPAGKFMILLDNQTGASLMSTGNTLKTRFFNEEIN